MADEITSPPTPPQTPLLAPEEMQQIVQDVAKPQSREVFDAIKQERSDVYRNVRGAGPVGSPGAVDGIRPAPGAPTMVRDTALQQGPAGPMNDVRQPVQQMQSATADRIPADARKTLLKSIAAISKMSRAAQRRILPAVAAQTQARLARVNSVRQQMKKERASTLKSLARMAKPTAIILVAVLIGIAGVVDLLDIIKEPIAEIPFIGWLVNALLGIIKAVAIGVPTFFMARKVQRISKATAKVVTYGETLTREANIGLRRVTPLAQEMKQTSKLRDADPDDDAASLKQFVLYKSRILLNQAVTQLLEALPLADLGPWQTFRVFRAYRDQQKEYRKLRAAVVSCQLLTDKLDIQARIEIEYLVLCLRLLQQLIIRASRRGVSGLAADASDAVRSRVFNRAANPVERSGYAPSPGLKPQFATG